MSRAAALATEGEAKAGHVVRGIRKKQTGIRGFDDISGGGVPGEGLTTIIGGPGAGKTVFAMQTLVHRLVEHQETGLFVTFEETGDRIRRNMASFDWHLEGDAEDGVVFIDAKAPVEAVLAGAFDLSGLIAGLSALQAETGARNVVFDGIDMLLSDLGDERLERQELARLDEWTRAAGLTALLTVKAFGIGDRDQRRSNTLQYMTDCVIVLETAFTETLSSRSLRIAKYRGSGFSANPVPVVMNDAGFEVMAFEGVRTDYPTFAERISSGVPRLDALLAGGYLRGSSILISGSPGTSKTSLSASFAAATCLRGEHALFVSFDESAAQIVANMRSIGLDLRPHLESGALVVASLLSSVRSPEEHFATISDLMRTHRPACLIIDPLSSLLRVRYPFTELICETLIDHAKSRGVTVLCTSLLDPASGNQELSASNISTIADTWMHVSYVVHEGERNRALTIIKSRGTAHSNQVRELMLSQSGIDLVDVYVAEGQVLMGSQRAQKEAAIRDRQRQDEIAHRTRQMAARHDIARLERESEAAAHEIAYRRQQLSLLSLSERERVGREREAVAERRVLRHADDDTGHAPDAEAPRG